MWGELVHMVQHLGMWLFVLCVLLLVIAWFYGRNIPPHQGSGHHENGSLVFHANADGDRAAAVALWARIGVTVVLLAAALFVILSRQYQADEQKWAFGVVGTIIGYWLKA